MKLLDHLKAAAASVDSPFQSQLFREDIARLNKLRDMARANKDFAAFRKEGFYIGWTRDDMRTMELAATLDLFLQTFFDHESGMNSPDQEQLVLKAWSDFNRDRMEKLTGCL